MLPAPAPVPAPRSPSMVPPRLGAGRRGQSLYVAPSALQPLLEAQQALSADETARLNALPVLLSSFDGLDEHMTGKGTLAAFAQDRSVSAPVAEPPRTPPTVPKRISSDSLTSTPRSSGRHLGAETREQLLEAQQLTGPSTPREQFDAFLKRKLSEAEEIRESSEADFLAAYTLAEHLGDGATSSVRRATRTADGHEVAVKIIAAHTFRAHRSLYREIAILSKLDHPHIIKLHEAVMTSDHLYLVMDLARGAPLFDEIVRRKSYSEADARVIMRTLLETVAYLHNQGIAHRDLKPENVLVDAQQLTIVDFGFAAAFDDAAAPASGGLSTPTGGTPGYRAPDMLASTAYGKAVDVWSLGVVAYILLCGFPPFFSHPAVKDSVDFLTNAPFWYLINEDTVELRREIAEGHVAFPSPFWDNVSPLARQFVLALLTVDKAQRVTCDQALTLPWMTEAVVGLAQPTRHLVLDVYRCDSPDALHASLVELPTIVQQRIGWGMREQLEAQLRARPSLLELKARGLYKSFSPQPADH